MLPRGARFHGNGRPCDALNHHHIAQYAMEVILSFATKPMLLAFATLVNGFSPMQSAACTGKPAAHEGKQQPDGNSSAADQYWTPERLRKAKPMELPHPPIEGNTRPDQDRKPSVSGSGNPGLQSVPPDRNNLLVPPDGADSK
jgi:hypothetical protein